MRQFGGMWNGYYGNYPVLGKTLILISQHWLQKFILQLAETAMCNNKNILMAK